MPEKVVVDTDHLREQAQYTDGAINQVGGVILAVRKTKARFPTLNHLFDPIIADLMKFGEVLTADKNELLKEIAFLEQLEGQYPVGFQPGSYVAPPDIEVAHPEAGGSGTPEENEMWNDGWISEDGSIPPGRDTITIEDEIGTLWRIIVNPPVVGVDMLVNEARRSQKRSDDGIIDEGKNVVDEVQEVVAEEVEQTAEEIGRQVADELEEVVDEVVNDAKDTVKDVTDEVEEAVDEVVEEVENIVEEVEDIVEDVEQVLEDLANGEFDVSGDVDADANVDADADLDYGVEDGKAFVRGKASLDASANTSAQGTIDTPVGDITGRVDAEAHTRADAEFEGSISDEGVNLQANASASTGASTSGKVDVDTELGDASLEGTAYAQGTGYVGGSVSADKDGVAGQFTAGANLTSGAEVEGKVSGKYGSGGGGIGVKTGFGADFSAGGSMKWNDVGLDIGAGLAFLVGGDINLSFHFNPEAIVDTIADLFDFDSDEARKRITEAAKDAIPEDLLDDINDAAEQIRNTWEDAKQKVNEAREALNEAKQEVDQLRQQMENAVGDAKRELEQQVREAEQQLAEARRDAEQAVEDAKREFEEMARQSREELERLKSQYEQATNEARAEMDRARAEMESASGAARAEAEQRYQEARREFEQLSESGEETARLIDQNANAASDEFFNEISHDDSGNTSVDGMNDRNGAR